MSTRALTEQARARPAGSRKRVFSGMQPSGEVHLGNYLGAFKGWVDRQAEKENFFCIVDLHALTVPQDPEDLMRQTRSLAAVYLAVGLDPAKSTLFIQSHVAAHGRGLLAPELRDTGWLAGAHDSVQGQGQQTRERHGRGCSTTRC